jgi:hypothetical protein
LRVVVNDGVVRETRDAGAIDVHHVDLGVPFRAIARRLKYEALSVRRHDAKRSTPGLFVSLVGDDPFAFIM